MRVEIVEIGKSSSHGVEVTFASPYGVVKGVWVGRTPRVSSQYDVELEVQDDLTWGDNIAEVAARDFIVSRDGAGVILQGRIETADPDGFCVLRIGESIVLLEVVGDLPSPGTFVRVTATRVLLYDSNF